MNHRRQVTTAIAAALVLVAAACGDDDSGDPAAPATDPAEAEATDGPAETDGDTTSPAEQSASGERCDETVAGSRLTFSGFSSSGQLDPTLLPGGIIGGTETAAIYDVLFTYDYDTNEVVPHLAEGITSNDDYTEFTLTLRDGVEFSDGTPLDAQMVADNIDRYFDDDATAPHRAFLSVIADKDVVDPLTLRLTMARPWAEFPSFLAEQVGMIVNTNVVGDDRNAFAAEPPDAAGVGPYILERNAPGEEIVLRARDDYWGGPVCTETLRVVSVQGGPASYDAFRNGEIDVAFLRDPVSIAEAQANGENGEFTAVDIGLMLLMNLADGHAANDPRLREAIWLAMDPDVLNERAYQGAFNVSMSLIHPESAWSSDDLAVVEHDPDRARELVDDAKADGVDTTIDLLAGTTPPAPDATLAWQGMLEAVGFDVAMQTQPVNDVVAQVFQRNFDGANWALSMEPAQLATRLYGAFHTEGVNNRGSYSSEEMDAALTEAMSAGPDERAAAVAAVNDIYVNDFVSPVFGSNLDGIIWQDGVEGVVVNPTNIFLFHAAAIDS